MSNQPAHASREANPQGVHLTVHMGAELQARLRAEAAKSNQSMSSLALAAIQDRLLRQAPKKKTRGKPKDKLSQFLDHLSGCFHLGFAAELAGVDTAQLLEWSRSPEVLPAIAYHQSLYLEAAERKMLEIGEGSRKGNFPALCAFLNAHHPQYGIKAELLSRILGDVIERFGKVVKDHLNDTQAKVVTKLLKDQADKKILQFK